MRADIFTMFAQINPTAPYDNPMVHAMKYKMLNPNNMKLYCRTAAVD